MWQKSMPHFDRTGQTGNIERGRNRMIDVHNIKKKYGKRINLNDISFTLNKGEIIGVLGENGCGKTSLLETICGIRPADSGEILCDEKPVYDDVAAKEKIAYVRDEQNYIGQYKGIQLVRLYKKCFEAFDVERFNAMNEIFHLDLNGYIKKYSKGQRMCMAFMLAMSRNADYLVLDEPFGGVDAGKQHVMKELLIKEMEKRELGIILSTHQVEDLVKLCDRVIFMKNGEILSMGTIDEITEQMLEKVEATLTLEQKMTLHEDTDIYIKNIMGSRYMLYQKAPSSMADGDENINQKRNPKEGKALTLAQKLDQLAVTGYQKKVVTLEECYYWNTGCMKQIEELEEGKVSQS